MTYLPSSSPSFSVVLKLSANDSVEVTACTLYSPYVSPVAKKKKIHLETTTDRFVKRTSRLGKKTVNEEIA